MARWQYLVFFYFRYQYPPASRDPLTLNEATVEYLPEVGGASSSSSGRSPADDLVDINALRPQQRSYKVRYGPGISLCVDDSGQTVGGGSWSKPLLFSNRKSLVSSVRF